MNTTEAIMHIPYFEIPRLPDLDAASEFDRRIFSSNPDCRQFLRLSGLTELPELQFEQAIAGNQLFRLVVQVFPGCRVSVVLSAPCSQSPAEFCAALERDPEIARLVQKLRGGANVNN